MSLFSLLRSHWSGRFLLLTLDYPPQVGGVARYHAAVVAALGDRCAVRVLRRDRHWLRALPRLLLFLPRDHLIVGELLPIGTLAWIRSWLTEPGREGRRLSYSVICHGLDLQNASRTPRKRWLARRILRSATHVIANSEFTAELAAVLGARPKRIAVVPPPLGITPTLARPTQTPEVRRANDLEHSRIILSVGRLIARKGFDTLIHATAIVRRTHPRTTLVIIGDGSERTRLEALAKRKGIAVRFLGTLDDAATAAWYAACDVFVLLPRELPDGDIEGFGIVYLEAGAFGKPVVGTRSGGVPEAIIDGVTGILVPPNDPDAAAAAIGQLLTDRVLTQRFGDAGRRRAIGDPPHNFVTRIRRAFA